MRTHWLNREKLRAPNTRDEESKTYENRAGVEIECFTNKSSAAEVLFPTAKCNAGRGLTQGIYATSYIGKIEESSILAKTPILFASGGI